MDDFTFIDNPIFGTYKCNHCKVSGIRAADREGHLEWHAMIESLSGPTA